MSGKGCTVSGAVCGAQYMVNSTLYTLSGMHGEQYTLCDMGSQSEATPTSELLE